MKKQTVPLTISNSEHGVQVTKKKVKKVTKPYHLLKPLKPLRFVEWFSPPNGELVRGPSFFVGMGIRSYQSRHVSVSSLAYHLSNSIEQRSHPPCTHNVLSGKHA